MAEVMVEACKWSAVARERLERMDILMCAVDGLSSPSLSEKARLRDMMEGLKAVLTRDAGPPGANLADADEAEYRRAAREALAALDAASNSDPLKSGWYNSLYAARVEVEYYVWRREQAALSG